MGPAEDLRLADQMVCLSVLSRVQDYTYWYFQFFSTGAFHHFLLIMAHATGF